MYDIEQILSKRLNVSDHDIQQINNALAKLSDEHRAIYQQLNEYLNHKTILPSKTEEEYLHRYTHIGDDEMSVLYEHFLGDTKNVPDVRYFNDVTGYYFRQFVNVMLKKISAETNQ